MFGIKKLFEKPKTTPKPDLEEHSSIKSAYYTDYYTIASGDNPSKLVRAKGLEVIDNMLYDEQVKACLLLKEYAILSKGWKIEDAQNISKSVAKKHSEFIQYNFTDWMQGSFNRVLTDLLSFLRYGFVVGEQNYAIENGSIYLDSVKVRHPNTFKIYPDDFGNIGPESIKQWQTGEVVMPNFNNKFIHYAYRSSFGNPYGRSDLEEAYRDWFIKNKLVTFESIYLEKFGTPSILAKGAKKEETKEILSMLSRLRGAGVGIIPSDVTYEIIEATANGGNHYRNAIKAKDDAISKAILVPSQLGFNDTGGVGSNAKAITQFDVFLWVIEGIQRELEETIVNEQMIRPLIDYNFGVQEGYPKFAFNPMKEEDKNELFKLWIEAIKGKAVKATLDDENIIREALKFNKRDENSELLDQSIEIGSLEDGQDGKTGQDIATPVDVEAEAKAKLKGTVGGVQGILSIQQSVQAGTTPYLSAVNILKEIYGFDDKTARAMLGDQKQIEEANAKGKKNNVIKSDLEDDVIEENEQKKMEADKFPIEKNMERVDFKKIGSMFETEEDLLYKDIENNIEDMAVEITDRISNKKIIQQKRFDEIDKLQLKYVGDLKLAFKKAFVKMYKQGIVEWKAEQPSKEFADQSEILPDEYLEWLNSKAFMEAGKMADKYKTMVKQTLIVGIENGKSEKEIMSDLWQAFATTKVVGATVNPTFNEGYLRTIVRTNINASFNKGRYIQSLELSDKLKTPVYNLFSEVLEGNTPESHPISSFIHGKYVLQGTELAQRLQYPLAYNDRGIMLTAYGGIDDIPEDKILTAMPDLSKYDGLLIS